jgi:microcystin-dependent protein
VDFSTTPTYLQITVDANNDGQITPADPPLLPRQSVVGAVYASVAGEIQYNTSGALASVKGSDLFDPAGKIKALAIEANNAITAAQLADDSVAAGELASNAVGTPELQDNAVSVAKMQDDSVGTAELIGNDTVPAVTGAVTSEKIADGTIQSRDLSVGLQNAVTPPGTVVAYAGITVPTGWELCDGREVGRTDPKYAALWTAIGTIHGVGNGTTTFNLPDYRGRFLRGMDDPDGNGPIQAAGRDPDVAGRKDRVGLAVGGVMGSVQEDAFQGHYHELVLGSNTGGTRWGFSGSSTDNRNMTDTGGTKFDNIGYGYTAATITTDYSHGPPRVSSETRPKNAYVNYLIKY